MFDAARMSASLLIRLWATNGGNSCRAITSLVQRSRSASVSNANFNAILSDSSVM
ncbi:hypothetical protein C4K35_5195 [Pseudomonas chlororaphis subsp. piscium]|uniref:Uncharacterized protein n=1 Tax=Pseudomonas chlororaphis subsp. aureofaciens TaxID=587851 RepID=A0AAD1E926_9PSED|nr:hypothetical protein C4K35_5195 [Pseudomonas chlororaphis subsp. piscium]AZE31624.1 hypothetical protein C4K07_4861 [Pseudomonas chlororaphis subsp. aureofaciens]